MTEEIRQLVQDLHDQHWHLDKRVPLALIFAVVLQTAGAFWWAASTDVRLGILEKEHDSVLRLSERLIRVETVLERIDATLNRAIDKLDAHTIDQLREEKEK